MPYIHAHIVEYIISSLHNTHVSFFSAPSRRVEGVKLKHNGSWHEPHTDHTRHLLLCLSCSWKWEVICNRGIMGRRANACICACVCGWGGQGGRGGRVNVIANLLMPPSNGLLQWKRCRVDNGTLVSLPAYPPPPPWGASGGRRHVVGLEHEDSSV